MPLGRGASASLSFFMAKRLLDIDPISGLATYHDYDRINERNVITYEQDTQNAIDFAESRANDDSYTRHGIKNEMVHYAHIPDIVLLKMKFEDGVDPFDPNNGKKVFDLVNSKYKRLKTANIVHRPKA